MSSVFVVVVGIFFLCHIACDASRLFDLFVYRILVI